MHHLETFDGLLHELLNLFHATGVHGLGKHKLLYSKNTNVTVMKLHTSCISRYHDSHPKAHPSFLTSIEKIVEPKDETI